MTHGAGRTGIRAVKQQWIERPEGGTRSGAPAFAASRCYADALPRASLLYPITLYFLIRRGPERRASRDYLRASPAGPQRCGRSRRHIHCFAAIILDRVFLLSERFKRFDIRHHGLEELRNAWDQRRGVLVFGSHLGSFDALRVFAQQRDDVKVRVVIDVDQNPAIFSVLNVLNPQLARIGHQRAAGRHDHGARHQGSARRESAGNVARRSRAPGQSDGRSRFSGRSRALPRRPLACLPPHSKCRSCCVLACIAAAIATICYFETFRRRAGD